MDRTYFAINEEMAMHAHNMMSFSDYRTGSKTASYTGYANEAYELAEQIAEKKPKQADRAWRIATSYARRLANNMNAESRIGTMCPSVMISGAGNFPTKKKEKQVAAWDNNMKEFQEIQKLLDKLRNILYGKETIRSDDEDALVQLEEKLSDLEAKQEMMKAVNAYWKKNKTLKGCPEISSETADKLEEYANRPDMGKAPFPSYTITNNGANIRRIKGRIETLKAEKSKETSENAYGELGLTVKENVEDMRLQMFFDDKPDEEVRSLLKSNGFKWSPRNGCWQRQLTENARYATKQIIQHLREAVGNGT